MGAADNTFPTLERFFCLHGVMDRSPRLIMPFHRDIFKLVHRWAMGELPDGKRHLAVCIPPRHGKTIIAHTAVAWLTGAYPDAQWIYASYSAEMAVRQTMRIKAAMSSEWYREVFPHAAVKPGQGTQKYFETAHGGYVYGAGMDGTLTGFGAGRKRREFGGGIVIDDPIKPSKARSATIRGNANRWFTETLLSRRNHDNTPILIIMQRVHSEDLVGHVMETMPGEWHLYAAQALDEATGEMLWPETFSRKSAEIMRRVDPSTFYAQYQQSPVPPGGNLIKTAWWRTFSPNATGIPGSAGAGLIFLTADTAYKAKKTSDASVIRAWLGTRGHLYCLDAVFGRWEFPLLLQEAKDFWERWKNKGAREFWVEDKASGTPLAQTLRDNGIPAGEWRPADFDFPDDKVGRMNEAAWSVHGGHVLIPEGPDEFRVDGSRSLHLAPHARVLVEECAAFAQDMSHAHDDHCDTLTMAVSVWRNAGGGK